MSERLIDKVPDEEVYMSYDRRCIDPSTLRELFDLIGYEVRSHGGDLDGFQNYLFLEPKKSALEVGKGTEIKLIIEDSRNE